MNEREEDNCILHIDNRREDLSYLLAYYQINL
jgi:hypothetical protein